MWGRGVNYDVMSVEKDDEAGDTQLLKRRFVDLEDGHFHVRRVLHRGVRWRQYLRDPFHTLVNSPLRRLLFLFVSSYVLSYLLFGVVYWIEAQAGAGKLGDASTQSFVNFLAFSVHTQATIGYGHLYPDGSLMELTVMFHSILGLLLDCFWIGVVFTRVSRATKRAQSFLFASEAIVRPFNGRETLMLRCMSIRKHQLCDTYLRLFLIRWETALEGDRMLLLHALKLENPTSLEAGGFYCRPLLALPWTVFHVVDDPTSPLYGATPESLRANSSEVMCIVDGIDPVTGNNVQIRHSYAWDEIRWGRRYVDTLSWDAESGSTVCDLTRFHETEALPVRL